MANTKEIQKRMKSIRDTMKITSAMYMISPAKLAAAKQKLEPDRTVFLYAPVRNCKIFKTYARYDKPLF